MGDNVDIFHNEYEKYSKVEIFLEYCYFLQSLPDLITCEKKKIVDIVRSELRIGEIENDIQLIDFQNLATKKRGSLIKYLSIKLGFSLKVLCPPVKSCILCDKKLRLNNKATQVVVHTVTGPELYSKYIYRCRDCKLVKSAKVNKKTKVISQDIYYHSDQYGNLKTGWLFYKKHEQEYIRASNEVFLHKYLINTYSNNLCHAWMSMEGQAEAYNQTWLESESVQLLNLFLEKNPNIGKHFNQKISSVNLDEDLQLPLNENSNEKEGLTQGKSVFCGMAELHRKSLSQAIFNFWIFKELQERREVGKYLFGPYYKGDKEELVTYQESVEMFLVHVEDSRIKEIYPHNKCTLQCKKRGCGSVWSTDGLWKLSYPICMISVSGGVSEDMQSYIPMVCTNSPATGQAFCVSHCASVAQLGYPTDLKDFLKSCSNTRQSVDPDAYTKPMKQRVDEQLKMISKQLETPPEDDGPLASTDVKTSMEAQGTSYLLRNTAFRNTDKFELQGDGEDCNKDTGTNMKLRMWSRGILSTIRGGGHIDHFAPLYNSESPTQVAMILIAFLCEVLKDVKPELWSKMYLSYDNMCNVDRLKLLKEALPLAGKFSEIWLRIGKVIDPLHIKNHKRPECKTLYPPEKVRQDWPEANLMVAEQTFCWMGRFKKILNSMGKNHFHFVLHRLVKKRNKYTEYCHEVGKYPLLPSAKLSKKYQNK